MSRHGDGSQAGRAASGRGHRRLAPAPRPCHDRHPVHAHSRPRGTHGDPVTEKSYGWVVLGAAFASITMAIGTLFTLAVFQQPLETSMGWTRSSVGTIALLNWLVMGLGSFASGHLSDRLGGRVVVLSGGVLLTTGLFLSSRVSNLWQFYVTFGVLVGVGVSCFYVPLTVTVMRWFETRRGMAAAVVSSGNGLGTF